MINKLVRAAAALAALLALVSIACSLAGCFYIPAEVDPQEQNAQQDQGLLFTVSPEDEAGLNATDPPKPTKAPAVTSAPTAAPTNAPTAVPTAAPTQCPVSEDGQYDSKDEVALYIYLYGHLPSNYITKSYAQSLGWQGGSLEPYAPGCSIGGDRFGNYEGILPRKSGRTYYECDIGTKGRSSRGAKRIVYSNDGLIYYTGDHYESFTLLYGEEGN